MSKQKKTSFFNIKDIFYLNVKIKCNGVCTEETF